MSAPVYVLPPLLTGPAQTAPAPTELTDLLRQLIALQQEQVSLLKAQSTNHDPSSRWRALLARWTGEFPNIGGACKQVLPAIERAYLGLVREVTDKLTDDAEVLTDEFVLAEFLDRYGTKLAQMGNIVNQLTPLADASSTDKG
ncbi:hypothetical protein J8F10_23175 [Gemmata sp. G18]|uniref:Uncharacterized protein n=1 Tax=Gemmata palustris TaxID=2822762 RepID=A0ABS5BWP3_9BACT|nr:hypothetical protein [Gemmata palustris]MBP3958162.1 hypothetical protein [Gemmata palustris]